MEANNYIIVLAVMSAASIVASDSNSLLGRAEKGRFWKLGLDALCILSIPHRITPDSAKLLDLQGVFGYLNQAEVDLEPRPAAAGMIKFLHLQELEATGKGAQCRQEYGSS